MSKNTRTGAEILRSLGGRSVGDAAKLDIERPLPSDQKTGMAHRKKRIKEAVRRALSS